MNCPICKTVALTKLLDGHSYEITAVEEQFSKDIAPYPTTPDVMRMKAAMYELHCEQCHSVFVFCISCKRFVKHSELNRITKPKWESLGSGSLMQIDGVFVEYHRCPFCGYSVGGAKERLLNAPTDNEWT